MPDKIEVEGVLGGYSIQELLVLDKWNCRFESDSNDDNTWLYVAERSTTGDPALEERQMFLMGLERTT